MKSKLLILAPFFLLQGCLWQTTDQWDIYRAAKICGGQDNIMKIEVIFSSEEKVFCRDGRRMNLDSYTEEKYP